MEISGSSFGEPEQDANSALTELDKGLRSTKAGEQCEAIVRFPRLFEKYPFPILINSAMLKLADVFRGGINFIRMWVFRVCQQSEKHLDKILNVEEFVRRIYGVIHSNDPVARALTLRTLGSIALIIPERKQVQHSIRNALDSHDHIEVEAAIYAAGQFAARSRTFAISVCTKISDMIQGLSTPSNMKLKLIMIFQYMYNDIYTATIVRDLCKSLLPCYPSVEFVKITLHTLTKLAVSTLVDISDQVDLLVQYLTLDSRRSVKIHVLRDLIFLAEKGGHHWDGSNVQAIVLFAHQNEVDSFRCLALQVLTKLIQNKCFNMHFDYDSSDLQNLVESCEQECYSGSNQVAAHAAWFIAHIVSAKMEMHRIPKSCNDESFFARMSSAVCSLAMRLIMDSDDMSTDAQDQGAESASLKLCLKSILLLFKHDSDTVMNIFSLDVYLPFSSGSNTTLVCETLAAMAAFKPGILLPACGSVLDKISQVADGSCSDSDKQSLLLLANILFQTCDLREENDLRMQVSEACNLIVSKTNLWCAYRIARSASRYGHHNLAADIYESLMPNTHLEHLHFWLYGLSQVCKGEACLNRAGKGSHLLEDVLDEAVEYLARGVSAIKAASTPNNPLQFQISYFKLRMEMLQCVAQLLRSCHCLQISPPPAIAASVALATRDDLQRFGRIGQQLKKSVAELNKVAEMFKDLGQSSFDADNNTLNNLSILRYDCLLISHAVESVALKPMSQRSSYSFDDVSSFNYRSDNGLTDSSVSSLSSQSSPVLELSGMASSSERALNKFRSFLLSSDVASQQNQQFLNHKHIDCILDVVNIIMKQPLTIPRFFFQTLMQTTIKLAVSPQPRLVTESILVSTSVQFAIKVEGVIQHGKKNGKMHRKIKSVVLTVENTTATAAKNSGTQLFSKANQRPDGSNVLTKTVDPHNDFFTCQFLINFPQAGVQQVVIDTSVIDESDEKWKTGPKSMLNIKSYDETSTGGVSSSSSATATAVSAAAGGTGGGSAVASGSGLANLKQK